MEGCVFKKYLSRVSHLSLIAVVTFLAAVAPMGLMAQDDMSSDDEMIMPSSSNTGAPPVILDQSDSDTVPDVEEYDG